MSTARASTARVYSEGYIWDVHDADTPTVLVPSDADIGTWKLLRIRIRGLYAPEQGTDEGKMLTIAVKERLLPRWTKVHVATQGKSYDRHLGVIMFPDNTTYADLCRKLMLEMDIEEGGRGTT